MSIQYWANNRPMKVSIDTYCRPQQASKSANRYLSQATIGLLLEKDPIDCLMTWNLLSRVNMSFAVLARCKSNLNLYTRIHTWYQVPRYTNIVRAPCSRPVYRCTTGPQVCRNYKLMVHTSIVGMLGFDPLARRAVTLPTFS